jgi:hemoglobin
MVARHASSKITSEGRIIWLTCYQQLLSELENVPEHAVQSFWDYINVFSAWMVNTADEKPSFHSMLFKK